MEKVSIFGHKVSPVAAAAVVIGSAAAIWFAWKQHQSASSSSASSSAIDPVTGLPASEDNQIDPLTNETYLAEAQQYGSVSAAEQAVAGESGLDLSSAYNTGSGLTGTSTGASLVPSNEVQGTTYASNAAWAQAVEAGLTDIGYSSTDVAAALGRYLGNLSETAAQAGIVQAAIAEYGPPPVGSYQVILAPTTGPAGSGGTTTKPAAKPPETSPPDIAAKVSGRGITLTWGKVGGATGYEVQVAQPDGKTWQDSKVDTTSAVYDVAPAKGTYHYKVRATDAAGAGPWSAVKTFTVSK